MWYCGRLWREGGRVESWMLAPGQVMPRAERHGGGAGGVDCAKPAFPLARRMSAAWRASRRPQATSCQEVGGCGWDDQQHPPESLLLTFPALRRAAP